jgi:hypothetical protein
MEWGSLLISIPTGAIKRNEATAGVQADGY